MSPEEEMEHERETLVQEIAHIDIRREELRQRAIALHRQGQFEGMQSAKTSRLELLREREEKRQKLGRLNAALKALRRLSFPPIPSIRFPTEKEQRGIRILLGMERATMNTGEYEKAGDAYLKELL